MILLDFELVSVKDTKVRRKYVLEVKRDMVGRSELPKALVFARSQLLQEVNKNGYNILLNERYDPDVEVAVYRC